MSDTITRTETESVSDSAKAASVVTDSNGAIWDLSNQAILNISYNGTVVSFQLSSNGASGNIPGVTWAAAQAAFLATRS